MLTEGASLDVHTDNVGPDYGDMACNMLLKGSGTLSIQDADSDQFHTKQLEVGKCVIFNS